MMSLSDDDVVVSRPQQALLSSKVCFTVSVVLEKFALQREFFFEIRETYAEYNYFCLTFGLNHRILYDIFGVFVG